MRPLISRAFWIFFLIFCLQIGRAYAGISVIIQPGDQTVPVGGSVIFGAVVTTTGGEVVTGYQWFMSTNNQSPYTLVGNSAALILNDVQIGNAGYYYVNITYESGNSQQSLASSTVSLVVSRQPQIFSQPASLISPVGSNAVFGVTVGGSFPLHFRWRQNGSNLTDNGRITGSSGTNLDIANVAAGDAGNYDIVVTNLYGSTTSQVATLQVILVPPVITSPTNAVGKQGYDFNDMITASGTAPITFGAVGLPDGLYINPTNGVISGVPSVAGVFDIALFATNPVMTATGDLVLTLADDIPGLTSATNVVGKQGAPFNYTITATNDPAGFNAGPLPAGLSLNPTNGVIAGVPLVNGSYSFMIGVTNAYGSNQETLTVELASDVPFITSPLTENGMQGQAFTYAINSTNTVDSFSAAPLPAGLSLNPTNGVISGLPLVSGPIAITIGTANEFGSDSQTLVLNLATGAPVITSPLNATGGEEQMGFDYTITASNSPMTFWASNLPMGLTVNSNTGDITGTPLYAGNYSIPIAAANAWGVGTATLQLTITNLAVSELLITNVTTNYLSPYLLEFKFSLQNGTDPLTSDAVVASPDLMTVTAFEDGVPVSPSETSVILKNVGAQYAKVLKGYLVLDFTESIASLANGDTNGNGISDLIDAEVASAQSFVNEQPAESQIGVYEFHRDDEAPQPVAPLTTDKNLLNSDIAGIWTNYVQGFPAGSRAWDALSAAITALGTNNSDESHYVVLMSDGQDDSSTATLAGVIAAATNANVQVYAVGIGADVNTSNLTTLTSSTLGRYYTATNPPDLALDFALIGKDLGSQYILRWATLSRSTKSFMPTFQINYQGLTAVSPPNPPPFISGTNFVTVTNTDGSLSTNDVFLYTTNYIIPPYTPSVYAGNVLAGSLRLTANADTNPTQIDLRTTYTPRYIRQLHLHYRANWPAALSLESTNPGEMLAGWTLTQTNDGVGGQWALLSCPNPALLADSLPYAGFGGLLKFTFHDPIVASNAFSELAVDNTLYTNTAGTNFYGFTLANTNQFNTFYAVPPPHGTPVPWLIHYGFTNNFAGAELLDPNGNGFAVWQDYLAGLNPLNPNSTFVTQMASSASPPQIVFNTVLNRTYRIDWAASVDGTWTVLRDGIDGTGGIVTFTDQRDLSSVDAMFYRVVVEDQ